MMARLAAALALWLLGAGLALAQDEDRAWVQVEARPTLGQAQDAAAGYAGQLPDVAGYYLDSGWYAVVLGPYAPEDAEAVRDRLVAEGLVPGDSYLADGSQFRQQFWPVGAAAPAAAAEPPPEAAPAAEVAPAVEAAPATVALDPALPDEDADAALATEAALPPAERQRLQVALRWAGVYDGGIDGAFGRGTRAAMARWQAGQGLEPTGILTTRERAALLAAYNAVLDGLGLRLVEDRDAGIALEMPTAVLAPPAVEPPFVRYAPSQDFPAQVVLLSLPGGPERLSGLYEILQTLEAVPPDGPRERRADGFTIEGADADVVTVAEATLADGEIKGFLLVWPAGDEERRTRLLEAMRASFRRLPGVLDPGAGEATEAQSVDLVSGLAVRRPLRTATGFWVDGSGAAVAPTAAVEGCAEVTLDGAHRAAVAFSDPALGLAVLRPEAPLAPRRVAAFQAGVPRIGAEVAVAGFPYGAALTQPALTFGTLEDIRGLDGEEELKRLALDASAGDAGGPVLDDTGAVLGMLLPQAAGAQALPPGVALLLDADAIRAALALAGLTPAIAGAADAIPPERLVRQAQGLAALVSCW